ncbi:MAG: hypothetical protein R3F30_06275 [Planctomycetota bacterium]
MADKHDRPKLANAARPVAHDKPTYEARLEELRTALVLLQHRCLGVDFSVVLLLMADDRIAANDLVNSLAEWMDPRFLEIHVFQRPSDEEIERPRHWRYWRELPPDGRVGIYVGAWAQTQVTDRLFGQLEGEVQWERRCEHARRLEQDLVDDGSLLLKLFLHVPRKVLKQRIREAEKGRSAGYWWIDERDASGSSSTTTRSRRSSRTTSRRPTAGKPVRHRQHGQAGGLAARRQPPARGPRDRLSQQRTDFRRPAAGPARGRSARRGRPRRSSTRRLYRSGCSTSAAASTSSPMRPSAAWGHERPCLRGQDAAGKGGRSGGSRGRWTRACGRSWPIAAPTEEERARHWLWRFWRHLPRAGRVLVFDRSWYGRVLVERVEGFAPEAAWKRAYGEIRDFEDQLLDRGMVLRKFWLQISADEQLRRFEARKETPFKTFKITDEDWRNRERWDDYKRAVHDMVSFTSTPTAPWTLVSSEDKRHGRIQVLEGFVEALERRLDEG